MDSCVFVTVKQLPWQDKRYICLRHWMNDIQQLYCEVHVGLGYCTWSDVQWHFSYTPEERNKLWACSPETKTKTGDLCTPHLYRQRVWAGMWAARFDSQSGIKFAILMYKSASERTTRVQVQTQSGNLKAERWAKSINNLSHETRRSERRQSYQSFSLWSEPALWPRGSGEPGKRSQSLKCQGVGRDSGTNRRSGRPLTTVAGWWVWERAAVVRPRS